MIGKRNGKLSHIEVVVLACGLRMLLTTTFRRGKATGDAGWCPFDEGIGVGRVGGFLMQSEDANPALVIGWDNCEPVSRQDLPSFLSVVVWFASGRSPKIAAAKLVFLPLSTRSWWYSERLIPLCAPYILIIIISSAGSIIDVPVTIRPITSEEEDTPLRYGS